MSVWRHEGEPEVLAVYDESLGEGSPLIAKAAVMPEGA